jgi:hypothetical protein
MPIVSSYTVARRRQPSHQAAFGRWGVLEPYDTNILPLFPRIWVVQCTIPTALGTGRTYETDVGYSTINQLFARAKYSSNIQ